MADNTGSPMDFPNGGLAAGNDGDVDLAKGLTKDGIQQNGTVGDIPTQGVSGK